MEWPTYPAYICPDECRMPAIVSLGGELVVENA